MTRSPTDGLDAAPSDSVTQRNSIGGLSGARPRIAAQVPADLPWLDEAAHLYDEAGAIGFRDGRALVRLAARLHRTIPTDLPWCGLYVGHCIRTALPLAELPPLWFRGRPWRRFGVDAEPQVGALLVFWLRWEVGPFGHVGFYWGEDDDSYHVLGGNQQRSIRIERFPKARLIDCRWPQGVPQQHIRRYHGAQGAMPAGHRAAAAAAGRAGDSLRGGT